MLWAAYEVSVHLNPLVFWIWFGSAVLVAGGVITLLPDKSSGQRLAVSG